MTSHPTTVVRSAFVKAPEDIAAKFAKHGKESASAKAYMKLRGLSTAASGFRLNSEKATIMNHIREIYRRTPVWPGRFSKNFNALYGSRAVRTANEERRYISYEFFNSHGIKSAVYHIISFEVYGKLLDYHTEAGRKDTPLQWEECQQFQEAHASNDYTKISFKSLRGNISGINYCCIREEECLPLRVLGKYKFQMEDDIVRYRILVD